MHIHFVSLYKDGISKCITMLNNTAAGLKEQQKQELYKEVKRKHRKASDFQVKVSKRNQQWGRHRTGQLLKTARSCKVKLWESTATKEADSLHGWPKPHGFSEPSAKDSTWVHVLGLKDRVLGSRGFRPFSAHVFWTNSGKLLHLPLGSTSPPPSPQWLWLLPKLFLPILFAFKPPPALSVHIWAAIPHQAKWEGKDSTSAGQKGASDLILGGIPCQKNILQISNPVNDVGSQRYYRSGYALRVSFTVHSSYAAPALPGAGNCSIHSPKLFFNNKRALYLELFPWSSSIQGL